MKPIHRKIDSFFDSWTEDMAYILGYFAADGSMYRNKNSSYYIAFYSIDEVLIDLVKRILEVTNKIEIYQPKKGNCKLSYTLQINSKQAYAQLMNLGFTPNKSLTLKFPSTLPNLFLNHFLRGYFDGDGNAYYHISKRNSRPGYIKYLLINLRSGNKEFLETLREKILEVAEIGPGSLYKHSRAFSLAYSGKDVVKLYSFLYPNPKVPHLKRKKMVLESGIANTGP